ncbi:MAG: PD-(D/E)XK nuclease family protein [Gemmatimonadota bacterium]
MALQIVRAASNEALWSACAESFLRELGGHPGPRGHASWMWLVHRAQRDALLEMAAECGLKGWLAPPVSFFSALRDLFRIEARPIGILTGRLLVARLAEEHARRLGLGTGPDATERAPARAHMLDGLFGELLPEGVTPEALRSALEALVTDDFTARRNAWVADTYEAFLSELAARERFDPRSIHALVAARIEAGGLREAIGGAGRLHIYGITSLRGRGRLFRALAGQADVEVCVYLPAEDEPGEWDRLGEEAAPSAPARADEPEVGDGSEARDLPEPGERPEPGDVPESEVQPVPDAVREAAWVARRIKALLARGEVEPHEVAVVARSGREDTARVHRALEAAGVPSTARIRTRLAEIPVLRALLELLRAAARGWDYRSLRQVLGSPYFDVEVDLRAIDHVATTRRVSGLDAWLEALERTRSALDGQEARRLRGTGVWKDRLDEDLPRLRRFRDDVAFLDGERAEREWMDLMLELLAGRPFGMRRRLCRAVGPPDAKRWDIVRLDQRGVGAVERLLREWRELVRPGSRFGAGQWHERLRRLLEANELALSTPLREGVQVLEAHEAALTPFRHTFVVHANDGVFPRTPPRAGVFSDEERGRLRGGGLPVSDREATLRRERTLWRAVTAGPGVTITYRTADANGVPRLPSLMVPNPRAERALPIVVPPAAGGRGAGGAAADEAAAEGTAVGGAAAPRAVSEAEHRRLEVARLAALRRAGDDRPFRTADPAALRHAVLTAFADELRTGGLDSFVRSLRVAGAAPSPASVFGVDRPISERPTPWNGLLRDPVVLAELARRFSADRVWSASQLQLYAKRPFDFLVERVLCLTEIEEVEEETTPLAFGTVAHRILERFYARCAADLPSALEGEALELFEAVAEETFVEFETRGDQWLGVRELWAVTREEVREKVAAYLAWELSWLAEHDERPEAVELSFGSGDGSEEGEAVAPVVIEGRDRSGAPARLRLRGRIDRVDVHGSGEAAWKRIVDYKSGRAPTTGGYADGVLLQSALYMKALEILGRGPVRSGVFRSIKRPGRPQNGGQLNASGLDEVLAFALSIPDRVRAGLFEAVQARSESKIPPWQPGIDVTRTTARISSGTRFDAVPE